MKDQKGIILRNALNVADEAASDKLFLFLNTVKDYKWFLKSGMHGQDGIVLLLPKALGIKKSDLKKEGLEGIFSWSGNQSRFSQIKYAFLNGVLQGIITPDSKVVCVLGPWGKGHLDTITVHDLALSWSRDFPFDPRALIHKRSFRTVMAVVDIALDIGSFGREGRSVGTAFVVGDKANVLKSSHQAVFNPFRGYSRQDKRINRPEVVESVKELALLDGAFVVSASGVVEAAGRHLDTVSVVTKELIGLGSRHRAAAGITRRTVAVAVVVSEGTGKVTIFDKGRIVTTLEPVLSPHLA
jgi:hypothetical protein